MIVNYISILILSFVFGVQYSVPVYGSTVLHPLLPFRRGTVMLKIEL